MIDHTFQGNLLAIGEMELDEPKVGQGTAVSPHHPEEERVGADNDEGLGPPLDITDIRQVVAAAQNDQSHSAHENYHGTGPQVLVDGDPHAPDQPQQDSQISSHQKSADLFQSAS